MQYGMVIDLQKCMGCQTCATSCRLSNNLPVGVWWNTVYTDGMDTIDTAKGTYPDCSLQHYPVSCQHCSEPACVSVCPAGATYKDEETGLVMQDTEACIGCQLCVTACPYNVRTYHDSEPVYLMDFPVGHPNAPAHIANTVDKCTFCNNLLDEDQQPMCVQACTGYARFFGDLDDPTSEVAQLVATRESIQLLEENGTKPNVYYLK